MSTQPPPRSTGSQSSDTAAQPDGELDSLFTAIAEQPRSASGPIPLGHRPLNAPELHRRDQRDFRELLRQQTPVPWVVPTLVLANLVVYAWLSWQAKNWAEIPGEVLLKWGSNFPPVTGREEWWRLASCCFLHASLWHIGCNMWTLWDVGRITERVIGNINFLIVYCVSGLAGSLASYWWSPDANLVGASGAVFGVLGALASCLWIHGNEFPEGALRRIRPSLMTFIIVNLAIGALHPNISEAAHLGGLGAGALLGAIVSLPLTPNGKAQRLIRAAAALIVGCGLLGAAWNQLPPPPPNLITEEQNLAEQFHNWGVRHNELVQKYQAGELKEADYARIVTSELVEPADELSRHWEKLEHVPASRRERVHQIVSVLQSRVQAWKILARALDEQDRAEAQKLAEQFGQKWRDAEELLQRLNQ